MWKHDHIRDGAAQWHHVRAPRTRGIQQVTPSRATRADGLALYQEYQVSAVDMLAVGRPITWADSHCHVEMPEEQRPPLSTRTRVSCRH